MGMQGHVVKIGVMIDDHGGQREINDKEMLELLYRRLEELFSAEEFKGIAPILFSSPEDLM